MSYLEGLDNELKYRQEKAKERAKESVAGFLEYENLCKISSQVRDTVRKSVEYDLEQGRIIPPNRVVEYLDTGNWDVYAIAKSQNCNYMLTKVLKAAEPQVSEVRLNAYKTDYGHGLKCVVSFEWEL